MGDTNVRLCTPTQTYLIRQVSSSNSVFLVKPTTASTRHENGKTEDAMELDGSNENTTSSITAIGQCPSTLELQPLDTSLELGVRYLKNLLPVDEVDDRHARRERVYGDIPLSDGEIDAAWKHMCAFEIGGFAWRPTAGRVLALWDKIRAGIDEALRSKRDFSRIEHLALEVDFDDEDFEWATCQRGGERAVREIWGGIEGHGVLERERCVKWVGEKVLEVASAGEDGRGQGKQSSLEVEVFLERWRDAMPERWREDVTGLEVLDRGAYERTATGTVRWIDSTEVAVAGPAGIGLGDSGTERSGAKGAAARKWHEKFQAGRR